MPHSTLAGLGVAKGSGMDMEKFGCPVLENLESDALSMLIVWRFLYCLELTQRDILSATLATIDCAAVQTIFSLEQIKRIRQTEMRRDAISLTMALCQQHKGSATGTPNLQRIRL